MFKKTLLLITTLLSVPIWAQWQTVESVKTAVGEATPMTHGISLDLPLVSEDGSAVPITVVVESPMTRDSYVESIQIFATKNPNDEVVEFFLTPRVGKAEVSSRIRINESQTIWAVARSNTGQVWVAQSDIRVTVGGCLMTTSENSTVRLSQPRIAVPRQFETNSPAEIRTLVTHPMETGNREGPDGSILPRRLVDTLQVTIDDELAMTVRMHTAVSANPYLRFFLAPQQSGSAEFVWIEDTGEQLVESVDLIVN